MFVNDKSETATEEQASTMKLETFSKLRGDGWIEMELGNIFNRKGSSDSPIIKTDWY